MAEKTKNKMSKKWKIVLIVVGFLMLIGIFSGEQEFSDDANNIEENIIDSAEVLRQKEIKDSIVNARYQEIVKEKQEKIENLDNYDLKKSYDDVSGYTWYKQSFFTHYTNTNKTSIYFGVNNKTQTPTYLNLKMSYTGDDWIFFDKAYLSYDGNTKEIFFNKYEDYESDNESDVWEWISLSIGDDVRLFLREFAQSENAKMRLSGKYTKTRKLSSRERKGILVVLDAYESLQ
tara:strand:- start:528 stop:1223 length:696 start_codon:yes stop_codon:yes gene_type:complete